DDNVEQALRGHYLLRRRAGGDPFTGGSLAHWAYHAGYLDVRERHAERVDMAYHEIARYIGTRIEAALEHGDYEQPQYDELRQAARAAGQWAATTGTFLQRWVEVTARAPSL